MNEQLKKLEENRKGTVYMILGLSGAGFIASILLLAFLYTSLGPKVIAIVAVIVAVVIVSLHFLKKKQRAECREFLVKYVLCSDLTNLTYEPKKGMSVKKFNACGFWRGTPMDSLFSREYVCGQCGDLQVEVADIDFSLNPEKKKQLETHWTGTMIHIESKDKPFAPLSVEAGGPELKADAEITPLVRELGKYVGENLYIHAKGNTMDVLLKNRIFGFVPEIYRPWTEERLKNNPFREVHLAVSLAKLLAKKSVTENG